MTENNSHRVGYQERSDQPNSALISHPVSPWEDKPSDARIDCLSTKDRRLGDADGPVPSTFQAKELCGRLDRPLLYDGDARPKPALARVRESLAT